MVRNYDPKPQRSERRSGVSKKVARPLPNFDETPGAKGLGFAERGAIKNSSQSGRVRQRELGDYRSPQRLNHRRSQAKPIKSANVSNAKNNFTRKVVDYEQSAKNDPYLDTLTDERTRYVRYRSDPQVRALSTKPSSRAALGKRDKKLEPTNYYEDDYPNFESRRGAYGSDMTVKEFRELTAAQNKSRSKLASWIVRILLVLIFLVSVGLVLYFTPIFTIKEVRIEGEQKLAEDYLRSKVVALTDDVTLLRVDTESIAAQIAGDPWIVDVEVHRSFPSTLVLTVTESEVAAVVEIPSPALGEVATQWLVSKDNIWLECLGQISTASSAAADTGIEGQPGEITGAPQPSLLTNVHVTVDDLSKIPRIKDVSSSLSPIVGSTVTDEGTSNAMGIINGFSPEMLGMVKNISAPDRVKTQLTLTNNVEVAFGAAEDVEAKEKVILKLLDEHAGKLIYVNVRIVDRATYRSA